MNHCRPPQNWSLECGAVQIAARQKSSQTTDGQYLIRFCKVLYRTLVMHYLGIDGSQPIKSKLHFDKHPLSRFDDHLERAIETAMAQAKGEEIGRDVV